MGPLYCIRKAVYHHDYSVGVNAPSANVLDQSDRLQPSKTKPLFFLEPEIIKKTIEIAAWTGKASASVTNQNVNKTKEVLQSIDCGNVLMYFRPNNDLIFILQITGYILVQQLFDKRLLLSPLLADFVALIDNVHCSCRLK